MPDEASLNEMNMSNNCGEALESMYPDIYHCVHPMVRRMCDMYDVPANTCMCPSPSRAVVEQMADQIYNIVVINLGIRDDVQPMTRQFVGPGFVGPGFVGPGFGGPGFVGPGFGGPFVGRGFLRDLIAILLIRELLFRRGRFF